jgi:tetraacyldisaccharide 4'-kinase
MGRLREWKTAVSRADAVIVTKSPAQLSVGAVISFTETIRGYHPGVPVFFSTYEYGQPYALFYPEDKKKFEKDTAVVVVSGLARSEYLLDKVHQLSEEVYSLEYPDHYYFTEYDLSMIKRRHDTILNPKKIILTTEKDATRLLLHRNWLEREGLSVLVLPVTVQFLDFGSLDFDTWIKNRLLEFKV